MFRRGMCEVCFPGVDLKGVTKVHCYREKENKVAQNRVWSPLEDRNLLTCLASTSWLAQQQFLKHGEQEGLGEGSVGPVAGRSWEEPTSSFGIKVLTFQFSLGKSCEFTKSFVLHSLPWFPT